MNLFQEIVNEGMLLNELKSNRDKDIKDAINRVLRVRISYDDKKRNNVYYDGKTIPPNKGKNERYILPVAYGLTKNGKRAVRAYQTAGSTKRGVPKWKLFLVDNIYSWSNGKKTFKKYGETLKRLGLNTSGDKHMTTLFAITPIGNDNIPVADNSNPIDSTPITKIDVKPNTDSVQNPNIVNKSNDFVPSFTKRPSSIDNVKQEPYLDNKVEEPKTEPITKIDVQPSYDEKETSVEPEITTEPITKNDVNGEQEFNKNNKLSSSFKDMIDRMDNLNKDNEEEDI